jgi:hypothetical protein
MALNEKGSHILKTVGPHRVKIAGSWAPAGNGAFTDVKGKGFTVARTGVGLAEVTFDKKYASLECVEGLTVQLLAAADSKMQAGAYTAPTSTAKGKIVVRYIVGAAVAEWPAADAANRMNFCFRFRESKKV